MKDKIFENLNKDNYNDEPVYYCANCLSLKIKRFNDPTPGQFKENEDGYCGMCTSTDIKSTHIYNWKKMFQIKYGYKHINIKNNKK